MRKLLLTKINKRLYYQYRGIFRKYLSWLLMTMKFIMGGYDRAVQGYLKEENELILIK